MHGSVYPSLSLLAHRLDSGLATSASSVSLSCPCSGLVSRRLLVLSAFIRHDVYHLSLSKTQLMFTQMLKVIWPSIAYLPNHLPNNAGITTSGMCRSPFVISATFMCPQGCFATFSIGPFNSPLCSSLPRRYNFYSRQKQSLYNQRG